MCIFLNNKFSSAAVSVVSTKNNNSLINDFIGENIVITDATGSLGKALAFRLGRLNATLAVWGDNEEGNLYVESDFAVDSYVNPLGKFYINHSFKKKKDSTLLISSQRFNNYYYHQHISPYSMIIINYIYLLSTTCPMSINLQKQNRYLHKCYNYIITFNYYYVPIS